MKVEQFDRLKPEHLNAVFHWCQQREMSTSLLNEIPKLGYICYSDERPVAVAFMREVEGACGIVDGLMTNPDMPAGMRDAGIDLVIDQLLMSAKAIGVKQMIAWMPAGNTLTRAKKFGFVEVPQILTALDLSKEI